VNPDWEWLDNLSKMATVITTVAIFLALLQLTQGRAAKHRDFENIYVQRYWSLMDGFEGNDSSAKHLGELSPKDQQRVVRYLQLCEDELDLRKNGFVSTKTWGIWEDGILSQCSRSIYREALANERDDLPSLTKFWLDREDPLKMNRFQKWWTGVGNDGRKPKTRQFTGETEEAGQPVRP
jgi:hypothetical protein